MKQLMMGVTAVVVCAGCSSDPESTAKTMDFLGTVAADARLEDIELEGAGGGYDDIFLFAAVPALITHVGGLDSAFGATLDLFTRSSTVSARRTRGSGARRPRTTCSPMRRSSRSASRRSS